MQGDKSTNNMSAVRQLRKTHRFLQLLPEIVILLLVVSGVRHRLESIKN